MHPALPAQPPATVFQYRRTRAKLGTVRCCYCLEKAGWWRRRCRACRRLLQVYLAHRGADMATILDCLVATGAPRRTIERFLDADPNGRGSVRDQIAADMTNQLLEALGQRPRQRVADVRRIRKRGGWTALDHRPRE
jgi:hypothetical protein